MRKVPTVPKDCRGLTADELRKHLSASETSGMIYSLVMQGNWLLDVLEELKNNLNDGSFFLADVAIMCLFHIPNLQNRICNKTDDLLRSFQVFDKMPYPTADPSGGHFFFLNVQTRKQTSPAKTARVGFRWKEAGKSQALVLSQPLIDALRAQNASLASSAAPLIVHRAFNYMKDGIPKRRLLAMRVYSLHAGGCACSACCKSRREKWAGGGASLACATVLVRVLDARDDGFAADLAMLDASN